MKIPTLQLVYPPECHDESIPHKARKELKDRIFASYIEVRNQMWLDMIDEMNALEEQDNG